MDRRNFLKITAGGAAALALSSCNDAPHAQENAGGIGGKMAQNYPGTGLLGFGAMRFPMIDNGQGGKIVDQEKVNEMIDMALEHGVNYFDTAPIYLQGQSEAALGEALSRHPRDKWFVATKLSNQRPPATREAGLKMYHASFENLKVDYIDYYLLHSLSDYSSFKRRFLDTGLMEFLLGEREAGRIRNLGFSFHGPRRGFSELMELHEQYHWDFVQIQMNYSDWYAHGGEASEYMYSELERLGIPVVIMEPLLGGRLANIPSKLADELLARDPGSSVASWAFRFCGSYPGILTTLSGMTYKEHLEDNLRTFCNFKKLEPSDYDLLEMVALGLEKYSMIDCTACLYCLPCPYGIDIPGIIQFYNRHLVEGTYVVSDEQKGFERIRRAYLTDYDKRVEKFRQADHCIGCRQCVPLCPQELEIPDVLHSIADYVENLKQGKI